MGNKYKQFMEEKKQAKALKKFKKAPKDENAPKRPSSAYFLYANEVRETVRSDNPDAAITQVMSMIGEQWASLEESKKSKYVAKAEKAKATYQKKLEAYQKTAKYTKFMEAKKAFYAEKKQAIKNLKAELAGKASGEKKTVNKKKK